MSFTARVENAFLHNRSRDIFISASLHIVAIE
jgi:hypothetical protein